MNIQKMADIVHQQFLTLSKHQAREVFELVMEFRKENSPKWQKIREEDGKLATEELKRLIAKVQADRKARSL